jgi:Tfp pilus assembly protein PilF
MKRLLLFAALWLLASAVCFAQATPQPAPPKHPETAKDHFDLAVKRFQAADLVGAERSARTAIALESHYTEAHYLLGRILLYRAAERNKMMIEGRGAEGAILPSEDKWTGGTAELEEAATQFRIVIKLDPKSGDAWLLLATCLDNMGEFEEAESAYRQVFNLDPIAPNARDAHNNLGLLFMKLKKFKEAKAEFDAALTIDPTFTPARTNLDNLKKAKPGLFK